VSNNSESEKILYGARAITYNNNFNPSNANTFYCSAMCSNRDFPSHRVIEYIIMYEDNPSYTYTFNGVQMNATDYLDAYIENGNLAMGYTSLRCPGCNNGTLSPGNPNNATLFVGFSGFFMANYAGNTYGSQYDTTTPSALPYYAEPKIKTTFPDDVKWYLNTTTTETTDNTQMINVSGEGTHFKCVWMQYMKLNGGGSYVPSVGVTRFMNGDSRIMSSSSNTTLGNSGKGYSAYIAGGSINNPNAFTTYYNGGQGFEFNSPSIGGHVSASSSSSYLTNKGFDSNFTAPTFTKYTKTKVLSFFVNEYKIVNTDVNIIKTPNGSSNATTPNLLSNASGIAANLYTMPASVNDHPLESPGLANSTIFLRDARYTSVFLFVNGSRLSEIKEF
jgi:hypothetical protein